MARTSTFAAESTPPMASSSLLLLFLLLLPFAAPDEAAEKAALLRFRQALDGGRFQGWNQSTHLCSMRGIICDHGAVVEIRLPGSSLRGAIPAGVFGNLTSLRVLSLRNNALSGSLPSDIASCTQLQQLHLQDNRLSGGFPVAVLSLSSLTQLVLADNNLSGPIPAELTNLKGLSVLGLEVNDFSGELPNLDLPKLERFNVSYNPLNGSIPPGLNDRPVAAFLNTSLCGGPLPSCPGEGKKRTLSGGVIAGIVVGIVLGLLAAVAVVFLVCRRKNNRNKSMVADAEAREASPETWVVANSPAAAGERKKRLVFLRGRESYELEDLLRASAEVLGKGTFGTTYKASLENGAVLAVKRLKDVEFAEEDFSRRVKAIGALEHPNLVAVEAYHYSRDEKLLVSAYMPMGSLSALLHGNRSSGRVPLIWPTRLKIALTAARGIEHIHSRGSDICHGNIKSSNVLLTQSYDAVVSDPALFQLAKSAPSNGASGYHAPEVSDLQKTSQKADVYSFGILLMELLTGKQPRHSVHDDSEDLIKWVLTFPRDEWSSEVFDMELLRYHSAQDEMEGLLQLAIDCCVLPPENRPTLYDIVSHIMEIQSENSEPIDVEIDSHDSPSTLPSGSNT